MVVSLNTIEPTLRRLFQVGVLLLISCVHMDQFLYLFFRLFGRIEECLGAL